jgi:hypothetical protein
MRSIAFFGLLCIGMAVTQGGHTTPITADDLKTPMTTSPVIVAYFSPTPLDLQCDCGLPFSESYYSLTPIKGGSYRVLLGRNAEGLFLIQNYYQDNKQAQSSPLWVKDPVNIFLADADAVIGSGTLYYPDGKVFEKFNKKDLDTREGEIFYRSGERAVTYKKIKWKQSHYEYWYKSGKRAVKYSLSTASNTPSLIHLEGWDENGNAVHDAQLGAILNRFNDELKPKAAH